MTQTHAGAFPRGELPGVSLASLWGGLTQKNGPSAWVAKDPKTFLSLLLIYFLIILGRNVSIRVWFPEL